MKNVNTSLIKRTSRCMANEMGLKTNVATSRPGRGGFTLVELLVVVLIIGVLSSVALPQYTKAVKKAKGVKVVTVASSLAKAANMAYLEDGRYTRWYHQYSFETSGDGSDFDIEIPALKIQGEDWHIWLDSGGTSARVQVRGPSADLIYHLSNGKLSSVTCSGSECSSYFPGTMLSSN